MNDYVGKICPFCKTAFQETDHIVVCSECDMPHHKDCWIENQGCTTFGCMGSIKAADGSATTVTASTLEYEDDIKPDQNIFCTRCGRKNDNTALFCSGCGARLVTGISQPEVKHTFTPADPNNTNPYRYTNPQYNGYQQQTAFNNSYVYSSTTTVDADVVQLIGTKSEYYYPKFQEMKAQNKKTSWNWCAFFGNSILVDLPEDVWVWCSCPCSSFRNFSDWLCLPIIADTCRVYCIGYFCKLHLHDLS